MPFDATPIKTNTTADVLRRARVLIDSPEKWLKYAVAEMGGKHVRCFNGEQPDIIGADRLCVLGAIHAAAPYGQRVRMRSLFIKLNGGGGIWNDAPERTHADVLRAFDRAIELAEAEG